MAAVQTYQPDANRIIHTASVDFLSRTSMGKPVHLVQYDMRLPILAVSTRYGAQQYKVPETAEASIRVGKKDGTFVIANALGCDATRTTLYFEMTQQMTVLYGEINPIIEVKVSGQLAGSSAIQIMIDRNPVQEGDIESTTEFKQLEQYVSEAATSAAESEKSAQNSEASAKKSENFAQQSGTSASQSATSAAASAASAKESSGYADNSKKSADASAASAKESSGYADNSATSASQSAASATASQNSATASATSASQSAASATDSQKSADASQTSANASANSASESADSAAASEQSAQNSQKSAEASAASASESSGYANNSAASAQESSNYADNSAASADDSQASAEASAASAEEAAKSAEEIKGWDLLAESYAHGNTGVRPDENTDSALYYYEQSKLITQGLQGALLPIGSINFSELENQTKQPGYMYNIKDAFTTTESFREGAGIYVAAGANVYWTFEDEWDILTPSTVVGVKGSAESSYQTGLVDIDKTDIGLGNVDNTKDSEKRVAYATTAGTADDANRVPYTNTCNIDLTTAGRGVTIADNTYYPVAISMPLDANANYFMVTIDTPLDGGLNGKPSWSTHKNGFTAQALYLITPSGWGERQNICICLGKSWSFTNIASGKAPFYLVQSTTDTKLAFYGRGGGKYRLTYISMTHRFGGFSYTPTVDYGSPVGTWTAPGDHNFVPLVEANGLNDGIVGDIAAEHFLAKQHSVRLMASNWSSGFPYTNRVAIASAKSYYNVKVTSLYVGDSTTEADYKAINKAFGMLMTNASSTAVEDGYITFKAYKKPASDFTVLFEYVGALV